MRRLVTTVFCLMLSAAASAESTDQAPFPCPLDTVLAGEAGVEQWCERFDVYAAKHLRHGPAVAWFANGAERQRGDWRQGAAAVQAVEAPLRGGRRPRGPRLAYRFGGVGRGRFAEVRVALP